MGLSALPLDARQPADGKAVNLNIRFGMPKETEADETNEFLVFRNTSVLSYSEARRTLNWVYWRVVAGDLGDASRKQFGHDLKGIYVVGKMPAGKWAGVWTSAVDT